MNISPWTRKNIVCHLMLERAAEIVETENRPIQAAYFVSKKLQLWIQKGEFREAAEKAKKLIRLYQVRKPTSCEKILKYSTVSNAECGVFPRRILNGQKITKANFCVHNFSIK